MLALSDVKAQTALPDSTSGSQDSTCGGVLRPRRETYIIEAFPSPAKVGQTITIQYYNHNPDIVMVRVVDILDRTIQTLQPQQLMPNGLHVFPFSTRGLASGMYFIRLTNYTSDGSINTQQDSRFIILH